MTEAAKIEDPPSELDERLAAMTAERDGYKHAYETLMTELTYVQLHAGLECDGYKHAYEKVVTELTYAQLHAGLECDGYRKAYESIAAELGRLRSAAAPIVRDNSLPVPNGPGIFAVTLPKSGTVYIGHSLRQSLGYDFTNTLVTPTFPKNIVWPPMAWDFARGGMISVSHMEADAHNVAVLARFGIRKILLHVRDPRAALHSFFHFQHTLTDGKSDDEANVLLAVRRHLLSLSHSDQIDSLIETYYKPAIAWLENWLNVLDTDGNLDCLVMTHDELARDESGYFAKVMEFYGIETAITPVAKSGKTHFRAGDNIGWRQTFSAEQVDLVTALLPASLCERFGWNR